MHYIQTSTFQPQIHRLRGVAILFIVALHCVSFFSWDEHPLQYKFLRELFDNGTVLFMFISGFLFQHLSRRFDYQRYLGKKLRNVLLPYAIVATPAIIYAIWRGDIAHRVQELQGTSPLYEVVWLSIYPGMLIDYALWFIPVIVLYYLAAPLLIRMDLKPRGYFLLIPLVALSVLGHRPTYSSGHNLQLALYFLSCYVFGMFLSKYRRKADALIRRNLAALFSVYLLMFGGHFVLVDHGGIYQVSHLFSFEHGLIDWLYLQKMLLAVLLFGSLGFFNRARLDVLDHIADISFTIYFVHLYILFVLKLAFRWVVLYGDVLSWLTVYAVTLAGSCAVALLAHKTFGRWSRLVVGS